MKDFLKQIMEEIKSHQEKIFELEK